MKSIMPTRSPLSSSRCKRAAAGFTLIELMVTIGIAAVLMLIAAPNFVQFMRNANLSDAVSSFISAANTARANAMKTGQNTYMVPNDGAIGWSSGWMVYTDKNWDQAFAANTDEVVLRHEALDSSVTVTVPATLSGGSANSLVDGYLMFNGGGYPRLNSGGFSNGRIELGNSQRTSVVVYDQTARVRSCRLGDTGC